MRNVVVYILRLPMIILHLEKSYPRTRLWTNMTWKVIPYRKHVRLCDQHNPLKRTCGCDVIFHEDDNIYEYKTRCEKHSGKIK